VADRDEVTHQLKIAAERIKGDALTIQSLTRFKEAAELVLGLIAEGRLDPSDGRRKIATLMEAEDFELEKRAIELLQQSTQSEPVFGRLEEASEKVAVEEATAEDALIHELRDINGYM